MYVRKREVRIVYHWEYIGYNRNGSKGSVGNIRKTNL